MHQSDSKAPSLAQSHIPSSAFGHCVSPQLSVCPFLTTTISKPPARSCLEGEARGSNGMALYVGRREFFTVVEVAHGPFCPPGMLRGSLPLIPQVLTMVTVRIPTYCFAEILETNHGLLVSNLPCCSLPSLPLSLLLYFISRHPGFLNPFCSQSKCSGKMSSLQQRISWIKKIKIISPAPRLLSSSPECPWGVINQNFTASGRA